jgi:hypothetical protein
MRHGGTTERRLVMALIVVVLWVGLAGYVYVMCKPAAPPPPSCGEPELHDEPEPEHEPAMDGIGAHRLESEAAFVVALLDRNIDRAAYRRAMEALARADADREPVVVPRDAAPPVPEKLADTSGLYLGPAWIAWPWWRYQR